MWSHVVDLTRVYRMKNDNEQTGHTIWQPKRDTDSSDSKAKWVSSVDRNREKLKNITKTIKLCYDDQFISA